MSLYQGVPRVLSPGYSGLSVSEALFSHSVYAIVALCFGRDATVLFNVYEGVLNLVFKRDFGFVRRVLTTSCATRLICPAALSVCKGAIHSLAKRPLQSVAKWLNAGVSTHTKPF